MNFKYKNNDLWGKFLQTGKVEDYLKYQISQKHIKNNEDMEIASIDYYENKQGSNTNSGDSD